MVDRRIPPGFASALSRRALLLGSAALGAAPLVLDAKVQAQQSVALKTPPESPKGQAVVGYSQEVTVLHPLMPANEVDQGVWWNLFSTLWGIDPDGKFFAVLAAEVPTVANGGVSGDGRQWRIRLRDDVKWHDGREFTADDVKFSLELIQNPKFKARSRNGYDLVSDITVENKTTLTWRMTKPFSPLLSLLAWTFIVPKHLLENSEDPNSTTFNSAPVGTGPFKWVERKTGNYVALEANRNYFGKGPYLERLIFKYIPDLNAMFTQFQTGEIDYIGLQGIPPNHYEAAKKLKDRVIHVCPRASVENLTLNLASPCLQNRRVRQALFHAMDTKTIIEAIYYGLPGPAATYLPKGSWAYNDALAAHEYNPDKAKSLLDAAGWKPGKDGIREKDGVRLEFTNSTTTGNATREQAQQLLAQDWQKVGVSLKINNMPAAVLWAKFWSESRFDSLMTNTTYTIASDPDVLHRFGSKSIPVKYGSGSNVSQFENEKVDELLRTALAETDLAKRASLYRDAQAIIRDELPMLPIFQSVQVEGTKAGLVGFRNNVNVLSNTWNAGTWYWQ